MKKAPCFFCSQSVRRRIAPRFAAICRALFTNLSTDSVDAGRTSCHNNNLAQPLHSLAVIAKTPNTPNTPNTHYNNTSSPATYTGNKAIPILIPIFLKHHADNSTSPRLRRAQRGQGEMVQGEGGACASRRCNALQPSQPAIQPVIQPAIYAQLATPRRALTLRCATAPTAPTQLIENKGFFFACRFAGQSAAARAASRFAAICRALFTNLSTDSVDAGRTSCHNNNLAQSLHNRAVIAKTPNTHCNNTSSPATYTGNEAIPILIPIFLKHHADSSTSPRLRRAQRGQGEMVQGEGGACASRRCNALQPSQPAIQPVIQPAIYAQLATPRRAPALHCATAPTASTAPAQLIENKGFFFACCFAGQSAAARAASRFAAICRALFTHLSTDSVDASRTSCHNNNLAQSLHNRAVIAKTPNIQNTHCNSTSLPATYAGNEAIPIFLKRHADNSTSPRLRRAQRGQGEMVQGEGGACASGRCDALQPSQPAIQPAIYAQLATPRRAPALHCATAPTAPTAPAQLIENKGFFPPAALPGNPQQPAPLRALRRYAAPCSQTYPQLLWRTLKTSATATTWRTHFTNLADAAT